MLASKAVIRTVKLLPAAVAAGRLTLAEHKLKKQVDEILHPRRKDVVIMKKSTLISVLVVLAAIAGALGAAFLYLRRREAELDEYEQLLFSEDFSREEADEKAASDAAEEHSAE